MAFNPSFVIRWNDHVATLESVVGDMKNTSPDVTLVCDGNMFITNRIVLAASSPLMSSLLKEQHDSPAILIVTGADPKHIGPILSLIHTGSMNINNDDIDGVVAAATQLQLTCLSSIPETHSTNSVVETFAERGKTVGEDEDRLETAVYQVENQEDLSKDSKEQYQYDCIPGDMKVIDEEKFKQLKKDIADEKLTLVKKDKILTWNCSLCDQKWLENSRNVRRHARRHMESHLNVKFQCLNCGNYLKSKESLYYHRSNYCKNRNNCQDSGYQILSGDGGNTIDPTDDENIIVEVNPSEVLKGESEADNVNGERVEAINLVEPDTGGKMDGGRERS